MLGSSAEEKAEACADEKRRCKNSAHRAGAKCDCRSEHFENQDQRQRLPKPLAAQNLVNHAVAIAADLRIEHSQRADN